MKNTLNEYKLFNDCVIHCMGKPEKLDDVTSVAAPLSSDNIILNSEMVELVPTPPSSASSFMSLSMSSSIADQSIRSALDVLKFKSSSLTVYLKAIGTLFDIINKILSNPNETKYRRLRSDNDAFQTRLGAISGSEHVLRVVGFELSTRQREKCSEWVLTPSKDAWSNLMKHRKTIKEELKITKEEKIWSLPKMGSMPGTDLPDFETPEFELMMNRMVLNPPQTTSYVQASPEFQQQVASAPSEQGDDMNMLARNPCMMQQLMPMVQQLKENYDMGMDAMDQTMTFADQIRGGYDSVSGFVSKVSGKDKYVCESSDYNSVMAEKELIAEAISLSLKESS